MATLADVSRDRPVVPPPIGKGVTAFVDRWIWVFMAALLIAVVLTGFIPDSLEMIGAVQSGRRPPLPIVLHIHAVLMGAWLALLLTHTIFMATGRRGWHMQLGIVAMVLAPAMVIAGAVLVPTMFAAKWAALHAANPALALDALPPQMVTSANIKLFQIQTGILFPIVVAWGLLVRRRDPATHKRLMILATVLPIAAATDRMTWLPSSLPANPLTVDAYPLLLVLPIFAWDLFRLGRIQRAYAIWLALLLPFMVAGYFLWNLPWWLATVPRLMGVA